MQQVQITGATQAEAKALLQSSLAVGLWTVKTAIGDEFKKSCMHSRIVLQHIEIYIMNYDYIEFN